MPWALTKKVSVLISICLAVVVAGLISAPSVSADAVTGKNNNGLASQTERWLRLRAIAKCFNDTDVGQNSYNQVENGEFLKSNNGFDTDVAIGYLNEDGKVSCGDGAFVTNTFAKIGYGGNIAAFCSVQPMASRGSSDSKDSDNYTGCMDGEGDEFDMDSDAFDQGARQLSEFKSGYTKHAATPAPWSPAPAIMYHVYRQSLIKFCGAELIGKYDPADENNIRADKRKLVVNDVDLETGDIIQNVYSLDRDQTDKVDDIYVNDGMQNVSNVTCSQMAQKTWDYDEDMAAYVKAYNTANPDDVGSGVEGDTGDGDGASEPVCSAGALGWVLCPVMHVMADTTEWVAGQLENYLAFNPFAGDDNAIKTIWSNLLNIANSLLVVAFLVVVFSQSTSLGLSNYGIKRMLPRIIAAAILMNLSYYICQIMVDLSNIAGVGVTNLVSAAAGSTFGESVQDVGVAKMAVAAVGIAAIILFFFLIPVVVAFLAVFFTIAARNAIIVLLVIVAPLAFAAWIFPNTEKYFKKWWELFINMLILYPLVMLVFAASIVAANVIQTAPTSGGESSDWLQTIIALIVLALPLFAMPFLFKVAGGALGKINDMTRQGINRYGGGDLANKGMQAMRGRTKERAGTIARERQARLAERFGRGYEATGRGRRTRTALGKSVGWAASGQVRKQGWEARKANADNTFKTLYEERGATDHSSRAALNAERKFELEQRNASAAQKHNLGMAEFIQSNPDFTAAAAGVMGERGEARIRGMANRTVVEDRSKEVDIHSSMLTRNSALFAAAGVGYDGSSLTALRDLRDSNNNLIAAAGSTLSHQQAGAAAGIPIQAGQTIDSTTLDSLQYATTNHLANTNAGARSVISTLSDTGALETKHIEALTENLKAQNEDATSIGYVVDYANEKASAAGMKHLQYNNVSIDPSTGQAQLNVGGNMGGDTGVVNRILQEGVSKITKEMYADNKFGPIIAQQVHQLEQNNQEAFDIELAKMNPRQIEFLVNAKIRAGIIPPASRDIAIQALTQQKADATDKYGLPG